MLAPLDDPNPPSAGGTASLGGGGRGASAGGGGTSGEAGDVGDGGEPSSAAGGSGGKAANGGGAGRGGSAGRDGQGASGGNPDTGAGEGGMSGTGGCSTNDECVKLAGEPYLCRNADHQCIPLTTDDCPLAYGDYRHPHPVYFGSFGYLGDSSLDKNISVLSSLMALNDINGAGGLPLGLDGEHRPLVMVVCNSNTEEHPGVIERGMSHLANDVRVKALLATLRPADLQRSFEDHIAKQLFFLSPISLTSTLTDSDYEDEGLIWNLLGQPRDFADAYGTLLLRLEAYLRNLRSLPTTTALKVALVTTTDVFDDDLGAFVYPRLRFNENKTASQNTEDGNFLKVKLDLDAANFDFELAVEQARSDLIDFAPDIIVSAASDVMTAAQVGLIAQLEATWLQTGKGQAERPYFILSPYNAGDVSSITSMVQGLHDSFDVNAHQHFFGITAASALDPTLQNEFAGRLTKKYQGADPDVGNYFDAVYTLAYALVVAQEVDGPKLAAAMPKLLEGKPFGTRPDDIASTIEWLSDPTHGIELSGTLGPPDFDVESGVRAATPTVFCYKEVQDVSQLQVDMQTVRYDRGAGKFTGTYPCMDDFLP